MQVMQSNKGVFIGKKVGQGGWKLVGFHEMIHCQEHSNKVFLIKEKTNKKKSKKHKNWHASCL